MNLAQHLEDSARKHPHKLAVEFEDQRYSFRELNAKCNHLAWGLKEIGVGPKDICVLMMPNHVEFMLLYYALAKVGAAILPVNFLFRYQELKFIFSDARPTAFFGMEPHLDEVRKVLNDSGGLPIRVASGGRPDAGFLPLENLYKGGEDFPLHPTAEDDPLIILYTSGTTGIPKGVVLTHRNMVSSCRISSQMYNNDPRAVVIGVLPFYHIYGQNRILNCPIYLGLSLKLFSRFDPEKVIEMIEKEERTIFFGVPTMYNRLAQVAEERGLKRSSLQYCVSGGASLPVEILQKFKSLFRAEIYEGYGLSETPLCIANPFGRRTKPGSIGVPIPEYAARITDKEGRDVLPGGVGELSVKGPGVMKGYLNKPEETAIALRDGWLYTGDIARMDEEGYLYIVDRKKDVIIRGGYNVYPRELEEILYQIPGIQEAAVFGLPNEDLGEEVAAVVVLKEGTQMDPATIQGFVKERVAPYKYPRAIRIVRELAKGALGKLSKREIRRQFMNLE